MKIIDIGICIDNFDPAGLGAIRCVRYSSWVSQQEKALEYTKWNDNDLFLAYPFLPTNINFIPEKGQAVKIINFSTEFVIMHLDLDNTLKEMFQQINIYTKIK
jgi:hypothetical protein